MKENRYVFLVEHYCPICHCTLKGSMVYSYNGLWNPYDWQWLIHDMLTFARHTNEWNLASASNQRYDNIHWCSLVTNEKLKFSNSQILQFSPEQSKNFWIINRRFMDTLTFVTNSIRIIFRKKHHFFRNLTLGDLKEPWIKNKTISSNKRRKIHNYNLQHRESFIRSER